MSATFVRFTTVAKDSRIGKKPITVPKGVTVSIADKLVKVKVSENYNSVLAHQNAKYAVLMRQSYGRWLLAVLSLMYHCVMTYRVMRFAKNR